MNKKLEKKLMVLKSIANDKLKKMTDQLYAIKNSISEKENKKLN